MPKKDINKMSMAKILEMRKKAKGQEREYLAGKEHRAFTRDFSRDQPLAAAATLPLAIPTYAAGKYLKRNLPSLPAPVARAREFVEKNVPGGQYLKKSRDYFGGTRPSFTQTAEAYQGLREGLGSAMKDKVKQLKKNKYLAKLQRLAKF